MRGLAIGFLTVLAYLIGQDPGYALSALLGVAQMVALVVVIGLLFKGCAAFHAEGMKRVRR